MSGKTYGYVRVSTRNQNEDRQVIAMREYGVAENCILVEKQSGKDFDRPLYRKLMRKLRAGDTLVVQSLDRLGRDYVEIQEQWRIISKERGVSIVVLDMPLLCTQENQELINRLITDLVLQLFSFVAQTEREKIRERQRQGIEAAKARGVRFGRPRLELPEEFPQVVESWSEGKFTAREAARILGISRSTFFRRIREMFATAPADESNKNNGAEKSVAPHVFSLTNRQVRSSVRLHKRTVKCITQPTSRVSIYQEVCDTAYDDEQRTPPAEGRVADRKESNLTRDSGSIDGGGPFLTDSKAE